MALLIGQPVDARELEQVTSQWPPERFAAMCDALAWAVSGRAWTSLPSFTNRVNARDGGIDAEWTLDLPKDNFSIPTPIFGPGWNVFQYKKRDLLAQDRKHTISTLKSSLKGAIADVVTRHQQHPDRYVLFVNVDLLSKDKAEIKESILKDYSEEAKIHVEIIGAAELVAFLNNHPHLRAAYFTPLSFKPWAQANRDHHSQKLFGANVHLIGRESDLNKLKAFVDDQRVRVIVLTGPHDMGKSRLALEATAHRPHEVVVALDPRSMELSDYRALASAKGEVVCIIEDPDPEHLGSLVGEVLTLPSLKVFITLPSPNSISFPAYGLDERVQTHHLEQLSDENAGKLLKSVSPSLDFEIENWIVNQAGGTPGIILAAASIGDQLRDTSLNFSCAVGKEFENRIRVELGPEALKCAQLFSLLEHIGIQGPYKSEIETICHLFGEGWTSHTALSQLHHLEAAGIAKRGGSFAQINIPLLANYLTGQLLQGNLVNMFSLLGQLKPPGQIRFLKRLVNLTVAKGTEVEAFWKEIFSSVGPLGDLDSMLKRAHLITLVAGSVPERLLPILEKGIRDASIEERSQIRGFERRALVHTLEQLLFRNKTSRKALKLLWLLAEAENENYSNNATGVLKQCFHPFHRQMPLPLEERAKLIEDFISRQNGFPERGKLTVEVIKCALKRELIFTQSHSSGLTPLDSSPRLTYEEVRVYLRKLVEFLFEIAEKDGESSAEAKAFLPKAVREIAIQGSPKEGIEYFQILKRWSLSCQSGIDVSRVHSEIISTKNSLVLQLGKPNFPTDRKEEFQQNIAELGKIIHELETSSFEVRLRQWAGKRGPRLTSDTEITKSESDKMAAEAIQNPKLLSSDLFNWLLTASGIEYRYFFFFLGKRDVKHDFLNKIVEFAQDLKGIGAIGAFSSYFEGWAQRDQYEAENKLDELGNLRVVNGDAIVEATNRIGPTPQGVKRIQNQLINHRTDPEYAVAVLEVGGRLKSFNEEQFEELLRTIVGDKYQRADAAVNLIDTWLYYQRPLNNRLREFAWLCLLEGHPKSSTESWHYDHVAGQLVNIDSERGFRSLEKLVIRDRFIDEIGRTKNLWDPFSIDGGEQFWQSLYKHDPHRLLRIILLAAQSDDLVNFHLSFRMKELLDQFKDNNILLELAQENVELGRIIASWITTASNNFWNLAFGLHQLYSDDEAIHSQLLSGIKQMGGVIYGPVSEHYKKQKQEVERILQESTTPSSFKVWLQEVIDRLGMEISSQVVWEYDMDVNHLVRHIQDKDSDLRLWAIGRVLKFAKWEDIRRLLTVDDIEYALTQVDLPEKRRTMLEQALPVWRHGT
jgi:hypothetical protein